MRVIVLGASGAFPGVDQACSGYVVEHDDARLVVDLGWGTLTRLFAHLGDHTGDEIDGVVITHDHPDHMADLLGLFRARWYARRDAPAIPLVCPRTVLDRLVRDADGGEASVQSTFDWREAPAAESTLGPFRMRTVELPHYVTNIGVRLTAGGVSVAFTGDTGPSDLLTELGTDVDLYVVDATDRHQQPGVVPAAPGTPPLNLTAAEAGRVAARAGARALLLSHLWPGNDPDQARLEAGSRYDGPVLVAGDGLIVDVPVGD